ncbi:small nucleolar ribonucleoprotein complex [Niveomyces insectorum RCEF 264]|uniref:Small nucleolar ribonucleoprotein complex n=1 Tax=Niveomyces insectorum RCEF 264 TaxID=1081102 RepID=A0A162MCD1_9HYPO|nr:small nucleolar ribonucleoprotein complex [Niveomyces insectorum RCEF 264]
MDIHRCRFVPYPASAINAVAFSHPHLSTGSRHSKTVPTRLAIGRANGDIEIWNPMQGVWLQEMTIPGGQDRSVEGLAWLVGDDEEIETSGGGGKIVSHGRLRLFSIGYTNTITEWDLEQACAKRHASGQHGAIWCLAAQPKLSSTELAAATSTSSSSSLSSQRLVGGTMDGCLVLYATDDDDLRFQRLCRTHKKNVKMTCIAFQTRQLAVVGCSDSTIRIVDVRNGAILHAMTLGRDLAGGARDVIVWSVRCLPGGDIVSGDSTGQVCIWDGRTYTQAQRIQGHTQDVLSLAVSADGGAIVSGGMDRRVVLYHTLTGGRAARWAKVWHRRYHHHDVKAMATFEAKGISVVVAGGPDATPVVLPLQKSGMEHHRTLSHLPQTVPVASAPQARRVICWWERQVHIWALDAPVDQLLRGVDADGPDAAADTEADFERNRRLVGRILIKGEANITAAAISPDGALVVVATHDDVKAFHLQKAAAARTGAAAGNGALRISKVAVPAAAATKGATDVAISPDGRWVCLVRGVENYVTMLECMRHGSDANGTSGTPTTPSFRPKPLRLTRLKRAIPRYELFSGLGRYDRRVTQVAFSPDSKMLAAGDLAGYIDTWVLRATEDKSGETAGEKEGEGDEDDVESASSSDEDSDAEEEPSGRNGAEGANDTSDGSWWVRNPRAKQLPKLSAAPVVLSFTPDVPGAPAVAGPSPPSPPPAAAANGVATKKANGTTAASTAVVVADDYVLLAITATSRLFAFHPLRARLVAWQRRLSPAHLPAAYRDIRDLAKGVIWQGPRAWLYGTSFLFMLDTSVEGGSSSGSGVGAGADIDAASLSTSAVAPWENRRAASPVKRKRKRGADTGAGSTMEVGRLAPQRIQIAADQDGWVDVDMRDADSRKQHHEDDDDNDDGGHSSSDDDSSDDDNSSSNNADAGASDADNQGAVARQKKTRNGHKKDNTRLQQLQQQLDQPQPTRSWHTFKYRPILGVVPLQTTTPAAYDSTAASYPPLEVALVERPNWDIDLPVRYDEQ